MSCGSPASSHRKQEQAAAIGVTPQTLSKAFLVRDYAPDLAQSVIDGTLTLDVAHVQAQQRKREKAWRDDGLRMLQEVAPDIAARVREEEITLEQGRKEHEERLRAERAMQDSVLLGLKHLIMGGEGFDRSEALKRFPTYLQTEDGREHLKRYFNGGLSEIEERLEATKKGLEVAQEIVMMAKGGRR